MLRKALMLYSINGIGFLSNLVIIPVLVHFVGFKGYGVYSIYISLSTMLLLVDTALSKALVGKVIGDRANQLTIFANGLSVYILQGLVFLMLSPVFAFAGNQIFPLNVQELNLGFWIALVVVLEYVLAIPGQFFQALNIAEGKHNLYARYQLFVLISRFFVVVVTAGVTKNIELIIASILWRKPVDILVALYLWNKNHIFFRPRKNWLVIKELWKNALPIVGTSISQALTTEIFTIYINWKYGVNVLGRYRSIFDLVNKIWFIATLYPILIYPKLRGYFAEPDRRGSFANYYLQINKFSAEGFMFLAILIGIAYYVWLHFVDHAIEFPFLFLAILLGVFMSAHSRLGVELLQAANTSKLSLLITIAGIIVTLAILLVGLDSKMHEVELAWISAQFIMCYLVDKSGLNILIARHKANYNKKWLLVILLMIIPSFNWPIGILFNILLLVWLGKLGLQNCHNLIHVHRITFNK